MFRLYNFAFLSYPDLTCSPPKATRANAADGMDGMEGWGRSAGFPERRSPDGGRVVSGRGGGAGFCLDESIDAGQREGWERQRGPAGSFKLFARGRGEGWESCAV